MKKLFAFLLAVLAFISLLSSCASSDESFNSGANSNSVSPLIYLYGETHSQENILEKELELWHEYYHDQKMRHLFVELPYYTAEYLNLWMQSDNDDILEEIYHDWYGTASYSDAVRNFYMEIKKDCPETVFHGTDVGHQYDSTGKRYLLYLEENGLENTGQYQLAQEAIEQGKQYYQGSDMDYRENTMTENFIREFDKLNGEAIMGIYGSAHTGVEAMSYDSGSLPCMANQLSKHYPGILFSADLSVLVKEDVKPLRVDTITVGGKEYQASYFGKEDLSQLIPQYSFREFWRLEDAYEDFKEKEKSGDVLPYSNYPMLVKTGEVFVIDYTMADNSVVRMFYRSDGNEWQGSPATENFLTD